MQMGIHQIDPIVDIRWQHFVDLHEKASVFHTVNWLRALQSTYGYEPVVLTTSPPDTDLKNGFLFCKVKSWLTGSRLVSLPFADHCEPLCDSSQDLEFLIRHWQTEMQRHHWKYLEVRPTSPSFEEVNSILGFVPVSKYFLHNIDLRSSFDSLFHSFDKHCVQRRIRRGDRGGLTEKSGRSEELLREFYRLFEVTRKRHSLPPTPYLWFQNLSRFLAEALEVRVAYYAGTPVSAILTLRFRNTVLYKYSCSDINFKNIGVTPWLLWKAIVAAKSNGATIFDLGRTEEENKGLLNFKNHWVPNPRAMTYWKFARTMPAYSATGWKL